MIQIAAKPLLQLEEPLLSGSRFSVGGSRDWPRTFNLQRTVKASDLRCVPHAHRRVSRLGCGYRRISDP